MSDVGGEPRLPVVSALIVAVALPWSMPDQLLPAPRWVISAVVVAFAGAMLILDPARVDPRSRELHRARIGFVLVFAVVVTSTTVALIDALVTGSEGITDSAGGLLSAGGSTWVALVITFAFLYWELDMEGPGQRATTERRYPDLAFPQDLDPEVAPPGWRPFFLDYLYLGLTNNLAFSPTDVMPLAHWAKLTMGVQSMASLLIIGLVIARAVNLLN